MTIYAVTRQKNAEMTMFNMGDRVVDLNGFVELAGLGESAEAAKISTVQFYEDQSWNGEDYVDVSVHSPLVNNVRKLSDSLESHYRNGEEARAIVNAYITETEHEWRPATESEIQADMKISLFQYLIPFFFINGDGDVDYLPIVGDNFPYGARVGTDEDVMAFIRENHRSNRAFMYDEVNDLD
ncbi:TPA: hypothetical protein OPR04_002098 [Citrobacter koseri]|nr:hypothetical protein [Citrobacter koseri]